MRTIDLMLKKSIVQVAKGQPTAIVKAIAVEQQYRFNYLLKVFYADINLQRAIKNAAAGDSRVFPQQIAAILTVWLSPSFQFTTTKLTVTILTFSGLPWVNANIPADTTGFPPSGSFRIDTTVGPRQLVTYTGITATRFTGCAGPGGNVAAGAVITAEGTPDSASAAAAKRDLFIAAYSRRAQNTIGSLQAIADKYAWTWIVPPPPRRLPLRLPPPPPPIAFD